MSERDERDERDESRTPDRTNPRPPGVPQKGQGTSGSALGKEHSTGTEGERPGMQQTDEERAG